MKAASGFLAFIHEKFDVNDGKILVETLSREKQLWNWLIASQAFYLYHDCYGVGIRNWTPSRLAMFAVLREEFPELTEYEEIRQKYAELTHKYELLSGGISSSLNQQNVPTAVKIAYLIRFQFESEKNFQFLSFLSLRTTSSEHGELSRIWQLVFAILDGILADSTAVYQSVFRNLPTRNAIFLICHAILCQPVSTKTIQQRFTNLLFKLPVDLIHPVIVELYRQQRPELAKQLTETILPDTLNVTSVLGTVDDEIPFEQLMNFAVTQYQNAKSLILRNHRDKAIRCLTDTQLMVQRVSKGIHFEIAGCGVLESNNVSQTVLDHKDETLFKWDKLMVLKTDADLNAWVAQFPDDGHHLFYWIRRIQLCLTAKMLDDSKILAQEFQQEIQQGSVTSQRIRLHIQFDLEECLFSALSQFVQSELCNIAFSIGEFLLEMDMASNRICSLLCDAAFHTENYETAQVFGQWLSVTDPENISIKRLLGKVAKHELRWEDAMAFYRDVVGTAEAVKRDDWAFFAEAAIKTGEYGVALESGKKMLEIEPKDAGAHILIGQAYLEFNEFDEAALNFDKAIEIDTQDSQAWLGMVELYKKIGDSERIEGLLLKALSYNPEDFTILAALGSHYFKNGDYEKARECLQPVVDSHPSEILPAELYVKLLWELQEILTLEGLLSLNADLWQSSTEITFYRGQLLLFNHQYGQAIPLLNASIRNENPDIEKIYTLLDAIIPHSGDLLFSSVEGLSTNYQIMVDAVQKGLQQVADDFQFLLIKAQIALMLNDLEQASGIFVVLTKYYEANLPLWKWQIQAGLGLIALREAQVNQAMAAFQSAQAANPEEIRISIWLAEATWMAQLEPQALLIADQVCSHANGNPDILEWYIDFLKSCGESSLARKKLNQLIIDYPRQDRYRFKGIELALDVNDSEAMYAHMSALQESQKLDQSALRKLAHYYELENQFDTASNLLERAVSVDGEVNIEILVELYRLAMLQQKYEKALNYLDSQGLSGQTLFVSVLKVDALIFLGKLSEAEENLREMVEQPGKWIQQEEENTSQLSVNFEMSREEVLFHQCPTGIYLRLALVYRMLGEFSQAIKSAEKALAFARENPIARYFTIMMMMVARDEKRLAQLPRILSLWFDTGALKLPVLNSQEKEFLVNTHLFNLETLLPGEKRMVWERIRAKLKGDLAQSGRGKLLEARIRFSEADFQSATENYQESLAQYSKKENCFTREMGFYSVYRLIEKDDLWFILGAIDTGHYKRAWDGMMEYYQQHSVELYANFMLFQVALKLIEIELTYSELGVTHHLPSNAIDMDSVVQLSKTTGAFEGMSQYSALHQRMQWALLALESEQEYLIQNPVKNSSTEEIISFLIASRILKNPLQLDEILPQIDMEDRRCLQQLALSVLETKPEQGLFYAKRALGISPADPISRTIYAMLAQTAGDFHGALHSIEAALQVWQDEWQWREWAAKVARLSGDGAANIKHTELLHQKHPGDAGICMDMVSAYLQIGSYGKALELLDKSSDFTREIFSNRLNALYVIAYHQCEEDDQALNYLVNLACEDSSSQMALLTGAEISFYRKAYDAALYYAKKSYEFNPKHPQTLLWLAKILKAEGHVSDALTMLRQIGVESAPEIVAEQLTMIRELAGDSDYHQELDSAIARYRHHPQLLFMKALECERLQKTKEAVQLVQQALREDSSHPDYHELAGKLHTQGGQLDQAIFHYSEAIKYQPQKVDLYLWLAKVHMLRREPTKALEVYHHGIIHADEDYRLYYESAIIMRENKKYQDAEVMFKKALLLQPMNEEIRNQLGAVMALNFVHNPQEARR